MSISTSEFERAGDRMLIYANAFSNPRMLICKSVRSHHTFEFATRVQLEQFQAALEWHLTASGWRLVEYSASAFIPFESSTRLGLAN